MYEDQIQLASFMEVRISFSLMLLYSFTMIFLVVSFLLIYPAWFLLCPWVWPKILFNNSGKFSAILFSHINSAPSLFSFWSSVRPKLLQLCPTLCDPMDCSPPVLSVHGILQSRTLVWVVMLSSRGPSWPRDGTYISVSPSWAGGFLTTSATHPESPYMYVTNRCVLAHTHTHK